MRRVPIRLLARLGLTFAVVWTMYFLRANVWFKLYPAVMVAGALSVFFGSLWQTPLIEVLARKMGENLDARGVAYCRKVTRLWTVFLALHLVVTIATVFASSAVWAWYNGCIAYVLMGGLFVGEWLYRKKVRHG